MGNWLAERRFPAAWVSLDTGDNDPTRFFSYLIAALQKISPGVGAAATAELYSPQPPPLESVLTMLINALCTVTKDAVAVLDDYHAIDSLAVHNAVAFLLDHLPPHLHLVIVTRADPPLPLAQLRALTTETAISFEAFADGLIEKTGLTWTTPDSSAATMLLRSSIARMVIDILADFGAAKREYREEPLGKGTISRLDAFEITLFGKALLDAVAIVSD